MKGIRYTPSEAKSRLEDILRRCINGAGDAFDKAKLCDKTTVKDARALLAVILEAKRWDLVPEPIAKNFAGFRSWGWHDELSRAEREEKFGRHR